MTNKCYNRCTAIGTTEQIQDIQSSLHEIFGKTVVVNSKTGNDDGSCLVFTVESFKTMPERELKWLINRVHNPKGLYIQVESQNISIPYFANTIFSHCLWSFEPMPSINAKIIELKEQGIEYIKKHLEEQGNIDFGDDCDYSAIYINDDGYAELEYYSRIELEKNGNIAVLLSDGYWLYEDQLTPNHIMDLLSLIKEDSTISTD